MNGKEVVPEVGQKTFAPERVIGRVSGRGVPNPTQKRVVFIADTNEDWMIFYVERDEILGIVLSKNEYPTIEDFSRAIRKCEDAPIEPYHLVGARILAVEEVE